MASPRRHGIPTMYAGYRMRSLLEARWASFFTELGWAWEYEIFELEGFIPDFLVYTGNRKQILFDVKPDTYPDQETVRKISRAVSPHVGAYRAIITRPAPVERFKNHASIGWEVIPGGTVDEIALIKPPMAGYGLSSIHGYWADFMSPASGSDIWGTAPYADVEALWRASANEVQWRKAA
jgi:hypothetical protein